MADSLSGVLRWLEAHDPYRRIIIACPHSLAPEPGHRDLGIVLDSCIGHATIGLPAQLLACGTSRVEYVPCSEHPADAASKVSVWEALTPGLILPVQETKHSFRRGETIDMTAVPLPRRALVGAASSGPLDPASDDQTRTVTALRYLQQRGLITEIPDVPGAASGIHLTVDRCTACNVCVSSCPHDALSLTRTEMADGTTVHQLSQHADRCRACQACVRSCPVQAITPGAQFDLSDALEERTYPLTTVSTRTCLRCGSVFPAGQGELCPVCSFRETNPFGSQIPPELARQLPPDIAERLMRPTSRDQG
ncbi:MAG: 4Fe-4S dicluster domain-containing protein [Ancrocorticia sp.]|uniref:4Fe-4S dicluster domain-containing protein n=1 Tax=Ancrocorticia sp. TaxID=2593684 RepID=UPI003F91F20B